MPAAMFNRLIILFASCSIATCAVAETPWFEDATEAAGFDFQYDPGMQGEFYFPEIMGGGVAVLDFDQDGLQDIYLVQGGEIGPDIGPEQRSKGDQLWRNESTRDAQGNWRIRFRNVTEAAGIDARGYGMGVAVGDYTNNGYPDIYLLNFDANQLWRNNGDGTFSDVSDSAAVAEARWSVSGSFADLDADGHLDLVVANYVDFSIATHRYCHASGSGRRDYCSPSAYDPISDTLYRNRGDGGFEDVSASAGLASAPGHGLGVVVGDYNVDGRPDIYVANDGSANFMWQNQGNWRFVDEALLAGNAVNADGAAEAGMGLAAGDYNRSGLESLFVTHLNRETNTLYRNDGQGWFSDVTATAGLGSPSLAFTGFGTDWLDLDNDGWLDLFVANGAVTEEASLASAGDSFPYHQTNQLFRNQQGEGFVEATAQGGEAFTASNVSRGSAAGDLNNDGRVDLVVANINGPARILLNQIDNEHHWLGLRVTFGKPARDAIGASIWLLDDQGQREQMRRVRTDGSYASARDVRLVFGLGADASGEREVEVVWPDGTRERFAALALDRYHRLHQGEGLSKE